MADQGDTPLRRAAIGATSSELAAKRVIDIVGAATAILVLSPVFLAVAVAIKLDSPGPVFFGRDIFGKNGQRFRALKFRSMVPNAHEMLSTDPQLAAEYRRSLKITGDPRVTRVGRFLRRTSLDELPQLLNVLVGEMSLVGPRMLGDIELARFGAEGERVLAMKPGLAGNWVANGGHAVPFNTRVELELAYVDNWSLTLDIKLLAKTLVAIVSGRGAE